MADIKVRFGKAVQKAQCPQPPASDRSTCNLCGLVRLIVCPVIASGEGAGQWRMP